MARGASAEKCSQWRERLQRFARGELSVAEFCRRERVSQPSFYQWRRKLASDSPAGPGGRSPHPARFLPVELTRATDLQVIFPNGARVTLAASDHELVRVLLESVAQTRTRQQGDKRQKGQA